MIAPSSLKEGSKVAIVAPARALNISEIETAVSWIEEKGFKAVYDDRLFRRHNQFAGTDEERSMLLQEYLDSADIDAIMCARGGYGTIRIIDKLNFDKFKIHPKWIIGYSDITVLHAKLQSMGYESLHASMPINFPENTKLSLDSIYDALVGNELIYNIDNHIYNKRGYAEAELIGGNISVIYSMLESDISLDTDGKILFLEDLDEYLYHIDRMMFAIDRAGKLSNIEGLIVGGLTRMHDNTINFGQSAEEIIRERVAPYGIPICFGFPSGHINDNRTLILGRKVRLSVDENVSLKFM